MKQNSREILIQILTIIGFKDNKEKFADEFIGLCIKQAFLEILSTIPTEKRKQLQENIIQQRNIEIIAQSLKEFVKPLEFEYKLQQVSMSLFQDYIETVKPVLSIAEKTKLSIYLNSLGESG